MRTVLNSVIENAVLLKCLVLPTQDKLRKVIGYLQMTLFTDTNEIRGLFFVSNDLGLLAYSFFESIF